MAHNEIHKEVKQEKDMDRLIKELVHELGKMSMEDLAVLRPELIGNLRKEGMAEAVIVFLNAAFDLVIKEKEEKRRTAV